MSSRDANDYLQTGYVCPPDAGPAWRKAVLEGVDMSLVELNLDKTPWQRLLDHEAALQFAEMLREAGKKNRAQP